MAQTSAPRGEIGAPAQTVLVPGILGGGGRAGWQAFQDALEEAPELRFPENVTWYERMLFRDSKIGSSYFGLVQPLDDYVWALNPNGADPAALERFAADVGLPVGMPPTEKDEDYQLLPGAQGFVFLEHLAEALLAPVLGFYPFELVGFADANDDMWWRMTAASPRAPATLMELPLVDVSGNLVGIRQSFARQAPTVGSPLAMATPPLILAERLAYYTWRADARVRWLGRPMARALYGHWVIKDTLERVDAINHERAGGVPVVETDETYQGGNLAQLQQAASAFRVGEDSGAALPPGAKMVLKALGGTDVVRSLNYHNEQIAQVWTDQVAALGQAEAGGNRALGQTQAGRQSLARRAVARWFASHFREQVVRKWWEFNLGPGQPYPTLVFRERKDVAGATEPAVQEAPPPNPSPAAAPPVPSLPASTGAEGVSAERAAVRPAAWDEAQAGRDRRGGMGAVRGDGGGDSAPGGASVASTPPEGVESPHIVSSHGSLAPWDGGQDDSRGVTPRTEAPPLSGASLVRASFTLPERPVRRQPYPHEIAAAVDFATIETQHEDAAAQAIRLFESEWMPDLRQQAHDRIIALGDNPSPEALAAITLTAPDPAKLDAILLDTARKAADEAGAELAAQSITADAASDAALKDLIAGQAGSMAQLVTDGVRLAAVRRATQLANPAVPTSASDLATGVAGYLDGLAHAWEQRQLHGAVQQAQTAGRFARFDQAEQPLTYYISALLDGATCDPCASDDGQEFATLDAIMAYMPSGANPNCEGGANCRCSPIAVSAEN